MKGGRFFTAWTTINISKIFLFHIGIYLFYHYKTSRNESLEDSSRDN